MTQPGEAAREHMQEESADELAGVERHDLDLVAVGVVAPAESHLLAVEVDETVIGDGAFVGVAPEVTGLDPEWNIPSESNLRESIGS